MPDLVSALLIAVAAEFARHAGPQLLAAASFIGLVPVMVAFVLLQRFFVAGLTAGAVKGDEG